MDKKKTKVWIDNRNLWLLKEYYFLYGIPFINGYLYDIQNILKLIKPISDEQIKLQTIKLINKCIIVLLFFTILIFHIGTFSFFTGLILLGYSYIIISQTVTRYIEREDYKLLKQLEKYLGDVRHYYHAGGLVEEAIYDSLEDSPYEISLHMQKIYDLIIAEDLEEIQQYKETAPNKYITTFVALCQITLQYGDTLKNNNSVFLTNLNHLKQEIHMELLKRDKIHFTFSGLIILTITPVLFLKPIEHWGTTNLPELERFYGGKYGILVAVLIFVSTMICYSFIHWLKGQVKLLNPPHRFLEWLEQKNVICNWLTVWMYKHPSKVNKLDYKLRKYNVKLTVRQYLIKCILYFVVSFIGFNSLWVHTVLVTKRNLIYYTENYKGASPVIRQEDLDNNRDFITDEVKRLKDWDSEQWSTQINLYLSKSNIGNDEKERELLQKEIEKRLIEYKKNGFHLSIFILNIGLSAIMAFIPKLCYGIKGIFLASEMEEEVMQFYSILIMLRPILRMNVETILEWLENFSVIFHQSIVECVDHYSFDNEGALNLLKEREPFLPFIRIVEDLEACDRVGVEQAFDELSGQRSYYMEKRKQDNEIFISNKGTLGKIAAYIPMILVIGLYLIVPFILESLSQLSGYMSQMNRMM